MVFCGADCTFIIVDVATRIRVAFVARPNSLASRESVLRRLDRKVDVHPECFPRCRERERRIQEPGSHNARSGPGVGQSLPDQFIPGIAQGDDEATKRQLNANPSLLCAIRCKRLRAIESQMLDCLYLQLRCLAPAEALSQ